MARKRPVESLSDRIRDVVESRGLTAYAVARASGLDRSTVRRFLAGQTDLTLATASPICAALGLKLTESARSRTRPARSSGLVDLVENARPDDAG